MYHVIKSHGVMKTLYQEAPTGFVAFILAELFYKFHSFALECLAFLATWYVLSWVGGLIFRPMQPSLPTEE